MPTKILVPLLGEGVEEVTLVNWLKAEGDEVQEFEGLVEIETDKVVTEIPSPAAGTILKIEIPAPGEVVRVGTILGWIGQRGEAIPGMASAPEGEVSPGRETTQGTPASPMLAAAPTGTPLSPGRDPHLGFISPVVARIAAEKGIDLSQVSGSGQGGRITKRDVLGTISRQGTGTQVAGRQGASRQVASRQVASRQVASGLVEGGRLIEHSITRRRIAEHMVMSVRTSPHVTTVMEADMSRVVAHREAHKATFANDGVRLTFAAYFVAAAVQALKAFPMVNSSWKDEGILQHKEINVGVATDLGEEGLIVPVIKQADERSLLGLARAVNDLAGRARAKKLAPVEVQGGTFSITNHGISGSLFAAPIINQPQCAILGVGAIQKRVVVISDEFGKDVIAIRPMVYLSLTFDHRILDGAEADHFLAKVVSGLESW